MTTRSDIVIDGAQGASRGTTQIFSVDFIERDGQSFQITSVTATILDLTTNAAYSASVEDMICSIGSGEIGGEVRVQTPLVTIDMPEGFYNIIWAITLIDGQTRFGKQGLQVRS